MEIDINKEILSIHNMCKNKFKVFNKYITHIRFPLFKNIKSNTQIDFDFPITALVGPNGSGKTSVLNALYGAPYKYSTGDFWFSTKVDPIKEGEGSPNRFIYGHFNESFGDIVETRKARVQKKRENRPDPNYWEPTKETSGDGMNIYPEEFKKKYSGRSLDRWNPVKRKVIYINFRSELSAFDKYFYFGHDPAIDVKKRKEKAENTGHKIPNFRYINKKEKIRGDSRKLFQIIESRNTSLKRFGERIAKENRLLSREELKYISYVLNRHYVEARWIKHNLFQGHDGISIIFKTSHVEYSEAFAGSGEVAIASCIVNIINAPKNSLVLLDEPEVSLHPGAQERLLGFLAKMVKEKTIQIVFSTHSPNLISYLPENAIKSFYQLPNGDFGITPNSHPYAAFRRLGDIKRGKILVLVEDRLAKYVVEQAIILMADSALQEIFEVEYMQGGAECILTKRIPIFSDENRKNTLGPVST